MRSSSQTGQSVRTVLILSNVSVARPSRNSAIKSPLIVDPIGKLTVFREETVGASAPVFAISGLFSLRAEKPLDLILRRDSKCRGTPANPTKSKEGIREQCNRRNIKIPIPNGRPNGIAGKWKVRKRKLPFPRKRRILFILKSISGDPFMNRPLRVHLFPRLNSGSEIHFPRPIRESRCRSTR